jgi:phosphohistidine phosphatase
VPALYAASETQLLELLQALPESICSVMLIGHNPGLHDLARVLASRRADLRQLEERFTTGAPRHARCPQQELGVSQTR